MRAPLTIPPFIPKIQRRKPDDSKLNQLFIPNGKESLSVFLPALPTVPSFFFLPSFRRCRATSSNWVLFSKNRDLKSRNFPSSQMRRSRRAGDRKARGDEVASVHAAARLRPVAVDAAAETEGGLQVRAFVRCVSGGRVGG